MPSKLTPAPGLPGNDPRKDPIVDRLLAAAADQIATHGAAAVSARSMAAAAGVSPSAINYNLGGVEHLFSATFAHGAAATADWLAEREAEIAVLPGGAVGAVLALEHVITEWTGPGRPLALLYQEGQAASAGEGPVAAWTSRWRDFWLAAADRLGLGEAEGRLMHLVFENEALYHLSTWSPALQRAALREYLAHVGAVWLGAPRPEPTGALLLAERTAGALPSGSVAPAAFRIAEAAADLVEDKGFGALTHRAVAARAGVTTGAVTHHFRTIEDLTAGAIRGQVLAMNRSSPARTDGHEPTPLTSLDALFAAITGYVLGDTPWTRASRRQLFLAAVRRPDLAGAAAVIRYAHGGTVRATLARLAPLPPELASLYSASLSRFASASGLAASAEPSPRAAQSALLKIIYARLSADFARLQPG